MRSERRPTTAEFTKETKLAALRRDNWSCQECGKRKELVGHLEIHHLLGIAIALQCHPEVSHAMLSSLENSICLCPSCHKIRDKIDRKKHKEYAQELLALQVRQLQLELALVT